VRRRGGTFAAGRTVAALLAFALAAVAVAAVAVAGCGGAGGETTAAKSGANPSKQKQTGKPHHDSGGGSDQFTVKGGDNSVQEFGAEASESELQAAATVLHGFLDARAQHNWAAACTYLSAITKQSFAQVGAAYESCATALAGFTDKVPVSTLREAAVADVGSLRIEGDRGFLIYRGAEEIVYAVAVTREDGAWKVASLAGTPLN
jgi:hypothetical protein